MDKSKSFFKKNLYLFPFIIGTFLIILGIIILIFRKGIISYLITNSDINNSLYLRKIERAIILPYELMISGICFLLTSYMINKFKKVNIFLKRFISRRNMKLFLGIIFLIVISVSIFLMFFQRIEGQDEGFHINNAKLVYEGKLPYIDFIYYKGPLFPYIEGLLLLLTGFNLYSERFMAIILKIGILLLTFFITKNLTKHKIYGILATSILAFHFSWNVQMAIIDTSAGIPCLFLLLSLYILTWKFNDYLKVFLVTTLFCISIATRLFIGPAIIFLILYFFGLKKQWKMAFISIFTSIIFILIVYVPFLVKDFSKTFFGMIGGHISRSAIFLSELSTNYFIFTIKHGSFFSNLIDKLFNFFLGFLHNFVVYIIILISMIFIIYKNKNKGLKIIIKEKLFFLFFAIYFMIMVVSSAIITPGSLSYSLTFLPLGVIIAVKGISIIIKKDTTKFINVFLIIILLTISVSLLQFPRFKLDFNSEGSLRLPISEVKEVAKIVNENTLDGSKIITFEIPVAVEAKRDVLHGLERGYFGFFLFDTNKTKELNAINPEIYISYLKEKKASAVVMSQRKTWDFLELIPKEDKDNIKNALFDNYYLAKTFDEVTDWGKVEVYLPK